MRMTGEPEYQHTANPNDTGGLLLQNCKSCGAVVVDREIHNEWHREIVLLLNRSLSQAQRLARHEREIYELPERSNSTS